MSSFCVGTMKSSHGWEYSSVEEAMNLHMSYWFTSRANQGRLLGNVPSFYYLLKEYSEDPDELAEQVQKELELYFRELFPNGTEKVLTEAVAEMHEDSISKFNIKIKVGCWIDGEQYDLATILHVSDGYYKVLDEERLSTDG